MHRSCESSAGQRIKYGEYVEAKTVYNIEEMFLPPHEPVTEGKEGAPIGLEFSRVNIYNCTFVLDLLEQAITAHRVQVSDAQFSMKVEHRSEKMTIGAGAVSVSRGEVRLNRKPDAPRARSTTTRMCSFFRRVLSKSVNSPG